MSVKISQDEHGTVQKVGNLPIPDKRETNSTSENSDSDCETDYDAAFNSDSEIDPGIQVIEYGEPFVVEEVTEGTCWSVKKAVLSGDRKGPDELVTLHATIGGKKVVILQLSTVRLPEKDFKLWVDKEFTIWHNWDSGRVFLYARLINLAEVAEAEARGKAEAEAEARAKAEAEAEVEAVEEDEAEEVEEASSACECEVHRCELCHRRFKANEVVEERSLKMYNSMEKTQKNKDAEPTKFKESVEEVGFRCAQMCISAKKKIQKDMDVEPSPLEESAAQALLHLEHTNQDLESDLKDLYIDSAIQIDVSEERKALVIHYPYKLRKCFRKIHLNLVIQLEKMFSGNVVLLIARGRSVPPLRQNVAAAHDVMLRDIVRPAEIVAKRIIANSSFSQLYDYHLDFKSRNDIQDKPKTFAAVFKILCRKDVVFHYTRLMIFGSFNAVV